MTTNQSYPVVLQYTSQGHAEKGSGCFSKAQNVLDRSRIHMVQLSGIFRLEIFTFPMSGWIKFLRILSLG